MSSPLRAQLVRAMSSKFMKMRCSRTPIALLTAAVSAAAVYTSSNSIK